MAKQMCQSCGMPLNGKNNGTEADGSFSQKYCNLCYENGAYKDPNLTVEQMQAITVNVLKKKHWPGFLAKLAAKQTPKLERWQVQPPTDK